MKKALRLITLIIAVMFVFVSCEQSPVTIIQPVQVDSVSASIKGNLALPESGKVAATDVWIKVSCNGDTKSIIKANENGSFAVSGLREDERYDVLFTTERPDTANSKDLSRGEESTSGYGGWLSNVTAAINEGNNVGAVTISPLGTIKGKVTLDGETENYDILVYIPGTSFSAYTNADGDFFLYNVPEGTYSVRATYLRSGFGSVIRNDIAVHGSKTNKEEHPVTQMDDIVLYRDLGVVEGKVLLDTDESPVGITVMVKSEDGSFTYTSSTDEAGSFRINDVKPETYTLYVSKSGFDSAVVEDVVVVPAATKIVPIQTLSSGVRYVTGKVIMEGRTDHSGALITATNTKETNLIYSAISNTDGDYSLVNMKPGQYRIVITANNYNTVTSGVISVLTDSVVNLGTTDMTIIRGTILGSATLEGRGTNAGIKTELMKGTDVYATTTTDDSGLYSFSVPQGNYSGVRLTCENFKSVSIAQSIALIANDYVTIGEEGSNTLMVATHVPVVRGRLTVKNLLSLDYSGIAVTLEENDMSTTTDHDGCWSFEKVPVGHYTLKFERENTNPVTMAVDIVASAEKNIEIIELIPNAASIEGHVTLNGLTDHSGVIVRATAEGMAELTTRTNAAGYFYIGNVVTTETYTVHFEKAGWVSRTRQVSGLEDLSINDITEADPVTLMDTTAPVLNSVSITVGNSELEGRKLNIYMDAVEEGSGIAKVYVNTTDDFTGVEPINYANPISCYVTDTEGSYTLYVKVEDKSQNQSTVATQAFSIADYKTVVSSVLVDNEDGSNDGVITWTKAKSPYYVTGNLLVDENTTLIIEPGVNVQFSGAYYIQVEGTLKINGTENEKVYLYGVGAGEDKWTGINASHDNGSTINHASITGMAKGLSGYLGITNSDLIAASSGIALGGMGWGFMGRISDSSVIGRIYAYESTIKFSSINASSGDVTESILSASIISGEDLVFGATIDSCVFKSISSLRFSNCTVMNSDIIDCSLKISAGIINKCELNECSFSFFSDATIQNSNIIDCTNITLTSLKTEIKKVYLINNYWGIENTVELNATGINTNLSFIIDYYDDFNVTKADLSGYRTETITDAGYFEVRGEPAQYSIGDIGPAGGIVFYDKGYYSDGWRYLECAPSDIGVYVFGYCRSENEKTYYGVGVGKLNTQILVRDMGIEAYTNEEGTSKTEEYAARMCEIYIYGGYSDWFLPSISELDLMYNKLCKEGIGSFVNSLYWCSTAFQDNACDRNFGNGGAMSYERYQHHIVRPVRAF